MSRIVLTGTPKKLAKPHKKDLALPDWNNSYFKHVLFDGLDLRGKGLNNIDFLDCQVLDCDLSGAEMRWIVSRRTSWKGSKLSEKIDGLALVSCHDLIGELLEQAIPKQSGNVQLVEKAALAYIRSSYYTSWQDTAYELVERQGFTVDEVIKASEAAFGHVPGFMGPWRILLQDKNQWSPRPATLRSNVALLGPVRHDRFDLALPVAATLGGSRDRAVAAKRAKGLLDSLLPDNDWMVQVFQADEYGLTVSAWPREQIETHCRNRWNFWEAGT